MAKTPSKTPSKRPSTKTSSSSIKSFFKRSPKSPTKSPTPTSPSKAGYPSEPCPELGDGWTVKIVPRRPGSQIARDKYYFDPQGNMYRSKKEAMRSMGLEGGGREKNRGRPTNKTNGKVSRSSPRKTVVQATRSPPTLPKKPLYKVGLTLSKRFPPDEGSDSERSFSGTITHFDDKRGLYKIVYEDDDEEELSESEITKLLNRQNRNGKSSPKKVAKTAPPKGSSNGAKNTTGSPKFEIGSKVAKECDDARLCDGFVTGYDPETKKYTITYTENSYEEHLSDKEVSRIFVRKYEKGTRVRKYVDDGDDDEESLSGVVGNYDVKKGMYQVHYSNMTTEFLTEGEVGAILVDKKRIAGDTDVARQSKWMKKTTTDAKKMDTTTDEEESSSDTALNAKQPAAEVRRRRASTKKVNYKLDSFSEDEEEFSDEVMPKAKKARKSIGTKKLTTKGSKIKKMNGDSDSDDFAPGDESEDDVLLDDASPSDNENDDEESVAKKPKKKSIKKKDSKSTDVEEKTKMSDVDGIRKTLKNNPDYFKMSLKEIKETQAFLDPCGMEATDDIIDRLVGQQLDRIGGLLALALNGDSLGSKSDPLVLGTACSGTDAPALALMLVEEQLEARGMGGLFKHKHVFSCEKEPYKQAYLARNFDSVLYPDIVKLCDDPPRDVYGQEQRLPDFNLFVAGTSCKNFSMMMSNKRLDIEDHGCSGETFLAAVELLMKEKPKFAIFENVTKAPWEKMSEYITGRINLSTIDAVNKSIKGASKGKEGELELTRDGSKILTHKVPSQVGIQCGAAIKGYTMGNSRKIHDVTWPSASKKTCTLTEFMKHNGINKKNDTLYLETDVVYCTHWLKVDTKEFGLPQTRERTYMFVWQPDDGNVDDDLGKYWQAVVEYLQFPVRHALESFILEANHDVIRVFREALNGPAGRYTMRAINQAPDFWDKANANANLPHNLNTRAAIGMDEYARPQTQWGPYGKMKVPPHWWLEYIKCKEQRCVDMLDILHASAARDAESHDSNFASYFWNISQNVSREKHRTSRSGIAGCITPGGDVFLPHAGRPLLGCEKLLLQGIPYFRLLLGNETEVQLGDLAGNAMSLTVVNATMLATVTCRQLRKEHKNAGNKSISVTLKSLSDSAHPIKTINHANALEHEDKATSAISDTTSLFQALSDLADDAIKSSIWCTCETSGRTSRTCKFVQCRVCSVACCRDCCHVDQGYQLDSHNIKEVSLASGHDPSSFEMKLRSLMPAYLLLGANGFNEISSIANDKYRAAGLSKYTYSLHQIKQCRMRWISVYYARDKKTSEALAELKIIVGELERTTENSDRTVGVQCQLTSFIPAKREPFEYGPMEACATATQYFGENNLVWKVKDVDTSATLCVVGTNESPSFRVQVGLNDVALEGQQRAIKTQKKSFDEAKRRGEERRWLYADNWKVWPREITVSRSSALSGEYVRADCKQTVNQSACWIRKQNGDAPELFLLLKPDVGRTGPDVAIISSSSNHNDASSVLATFPWDWQPCDALKTDKHIVKVSISNWKELSMTCSSFSNSITVDSPKNEDSSLLIKITGLSDSEISDLCCRDDESGLEPLVYLNVHRGARAQQTVRRFNLLCVAPILKHAAANGLKYDLSLNAPWKKIEPNDVPFGCCLVTLPSRPTESWSFDPERCLWERHSEPGASRRYFTALQNAPQCFDFVADRVERSLGIKCTPDVAAHHAAHALIDGRGDGLENGVLVNFRLLSVQEDPVLDRFRLHNCHDLPETHVQLKGEYELYERQKRAVTKMVRIERGEVEFEEIEMNEQAMPGATGWSLIARASRTAKLRGGVIADAIGAGKTVISIAIILQGIKAAREKRSFPRKTSASLVVVPPGLIDQWKKEVEKFTDEMPSVICIYDDSAVKNTTLKQIIDADIVICPVDLLEANGYMSRLARVAAGVKDDKEVPQLPKETGQLEKNGASGVWIPATSQDPFGGANNPKSQQRRNESAYFTHIYLEYIQKLREKDFKPHEKGIPIEYFEWERVFIDEIHECLCTSKDELKEAKASKDNSSGFFKEKNRRAGREFLGITTKDISKRPLVFRQAIFGLTATPLLDSTNRVIELANLMGNAYIIGLSSHWRNLERESGRDIFLSNFLEPKQSREIRKNIYAKCQDYLDRACCKNKNEEDMEGIEKVHIIERVMMTEQEGVLYKKSQSGMAVPSFSTKVEDFDVTAGHDISKFLRQNASLVSRGKKLVELCKSIISQKGNEHTKIIVFADGRIGAGNVARDFLMQDEGLGCTWLDESDTVQEKNQKLAWYQYADVTEEDKKRPRVLVLHFEHAAGLNLQAECNNLILFTPLYVGEGGTSGDVVADVSTEMQAIGRVFRPGQPKSKVYIYRIEVKGPDGEECLDGQLIRRNTDKDTEQMAVNADD